MIEGKSCIVSLPFLQLNAIVAMLLSLINGYFSASAVTYSFGQEIIKTTMVCFDSITVLDMRFVHNMNSVIKMRALIFYKLLSLAFDLILFVIVVCMYKGWATKISPCTMTFEDLMCFPF
jgi:hypothetical protein